MASPRVFAPALVVAEVGAMLRHALAAWLASTAGGAETGRTGVQLRLLRLLLPADLRNAPAVAGSLGEAAPRTEPAAGAVDLEYLAWADVVEPATEERLIGAVLGWLQSCPVQTLQIRAEQSGVEETWRLVLTPVELTREEVIRLWSVPACSGRALLAFVVRARRGA